MPALLQATKRGHLFVLNPATGEPLEPIQERPVPQTGSALGEWLAKTQPYPAGMPAIGTQPLSEARMWSATPFDQLWCRFRFRQLRDEGDFTPPGATASLEYPGNYGGFNWGSVSVDQTNGYVFLNDTRLPVTVRLMPPDEARQVIAHTKAWGIGMGRPFRQALPRRSCRAIDVATRHTLQ